MLRQQGQSSFCVLVALWAVAGASVSLAFSVPPVALTRRSKSQSQSVSFGLGATIADETSDLLGSKTICKENYDIVNVDLDDGRDYPIYIGTGYDDEEGT
jgi:hypothetical protein